MVSQTYTYVLDENDGMLAYGHYDSNSTLLVVKNIFNDSYKKEFIFDNILKSADPIISAEFSDDGKYITVEYYTENNSKSTKVFSL